MKNIYSLFICVALLMITGCAAENMKEVKKEDSHSIWPTEEWAESTPEEQGVDSKKLVELLEYVDEDIKSRHLHGLLIIRNGHIILERYEFPYHEKFPHIVYSVTKSLTGAVTGIAIEEEIISLEDRVLDFFPDREFQNMSLEKENMTIEQLLTMTNGVQWPEWENMTKVFRDWEASEDQLQYYLDQPVVKEQVGSFNYDTGSAVVLATILEKQLNKKIQDYAAEKIFNKIGITSLEWAETNEGNPNGGTYAEMTPRDMARFGYLYLNNGEWDGEQIIPYDWVQTSTISHTGEETSGYGYYFWTSEYDGKRAYIAMGGFNQYIVVIPEDELIIVQTSRNYDFMTLLQDYIMPSIVSDEPLLENKEAYKKLVELLARDE